MRWPDRLRHQVVRLPVMAVGAGKTDNDKADTPLNFKIGARPQK